MLISLSPHLFWSCSLGLSLYLFVCLSLSLSILSGSPCPSVCLSPPVCLSVLFPAPAGRHHQDEIDLDHVLEILGAQGRPRPGPDAILRRHALPSPLSACLWLPNTTGTGGSLSSACHSDSCPLLPPQLSPAVFPRPGCAFPTSRPLQVGYPQLPRYAAPLSSSNLPSERCSRSFFHVKNTESFPVLSPRGPCSEHGMSYHYHYLVIGLEL